jgi:hypothetical protein
MGWQGGGKTYLFELFLEELAVVGLDQTLAWRVARNVSHGGLVVKQIFSPPGRLCYVLFLMVDA